MFEKLLAKIGDAFERHNVPYMLIGGQAVLLYGELGLTRDIDINIKYAKQVLKVYNLQNEK